MSTDKDGQNAFFHCLIFYEKFSAVDLRTDFDPENEKVKKLVRKRTQLEALKKQQQ